MALHHLSLNMVVFHQKTPYDFFQAWNSVKKNDTKDYADLLRQLETKRLTKGTKSVKILAMLKMGNGGGGGGCV